MTTSKKIVRNHISVLLAYHPAKIVFYDNFQRFNLSLYNFFKYFFESPLGHVPQRGSVPGTIPIFQIIMLSTFQPYSWDIPHVRTRSSTMQNPKPLQDFFSLPIWCNGYKSTGASNYLVEPCPSSYLTACPLEMMVAIGFRFNGSVCTAADPTQHFFLFPILRIFNKLIS